MALTRLLYEKTVRARGMIPAGVDEAGRGPIAGPVVAAAAIVPEGFCLAVDDSKKLSPSRRQKLFDRFKQNGVQYSVATADAKEIDEINILRATLKAMERAVNGLPTVPGFLLIDGKDRIDFPAKQRTIKGGDGKCVSIAVASIVAKVTRDGIMRRLHGRYPVYNFLKHKGYPTAEHRSLVRRHGVCPEHRTSFRLTGLK